MISGTNYTILFGKAVVFHRAITRTDAFIEAAYDADNWELSAWNAGTVMEELRAESNIDLKLNALFDSVSEDRAKAISQYDELFGTELLRVADRKSSYYVSRYLDGGFIDSHQDEGIKEDNGFYTEIIYLNDGYKGGELTFLDSNGEPLARYKPEMGDLLVFPCYYTHSAEACIGTKFFTISIHNLNS